MYNGVEICDMFYIYVHLFLYIYNVYIIWYMYNCVQINEMFYIYIVYTYLYNSCLINYIDGISNYLGGIVYCIVYTVYTIYTWYNKLYIYSLWCTVNWRITESLWSCLYYGYCIMYTV